MGIKWNASGGTGVMSPGDNPLSSDQSDTSDAKFGGHREYSKTAKAQDYTSRTGKAPNVKKNPVDDTVKDIDDMTDPNQRKREFSRREETSNTQANNESGFITKSDADNRPPEDTDAFEPDNTIKRHRSKSKGQFGDGQYDNNPNRGYEGEVR